MPRRARSLRAIAAAGILAAVLVPDTAVAGPAVLLEAGSGRVLYAEDQDHGWYPASLTKIMTAYIAFEEVKAGRLKLTDMLSASETAHAQSPSKLGLPVGGEITLDLGLRALIVKSANDVAVMIAERISGSVEAFAERMNATAKRLGMTRTRFTNPNGLPAPDQVTTARDLARLAYAAIRDFPEQDAMWALQEVRIGKQRLRTHNRLLGGYEGADGIKTGFICDSGFNVVASATRDGRRLVAVVLGEPSGKDRNLRAATLLEHGFATSEWKRLFGSQTLETLPVDAAAKAVASVRTSVVAWNCGGRKPAVARKGVKRRAAEGGAASGTAAKATATKVGAAGAKNKALAAGAGAAQPKAPAPAKKPAPAATPRAAVAKE